MKQPRLLLIAALGVLALSSPLRADPIAWAYSWSPSPTLYADGGSSGNVTLSSVATQNAFGNSAVVATNLNTVSSASASAPDQLVSGGQYSLTMTLTDSASNQSGTLSFMGKLSGTFSSMSSNLTNAYSGAFSKSIALGGNTYTVTLNSYVPPGPPSATIAGAIGAYVSVVNGIPGGNPHPSSVAPEPSSLLLCGFGAIGCALAGWRRRRAAARIASAC